MNLNHQITGLVRLVFAGMLTMTISGNAAANDAAQSDWDIQQWKQDLLDAREARAERFAANRTTALAGIDHHRYGGPKPLYVHVSDTGITYNETETADSKLVITPDGEYWQWQSMDPAVSASYRGKPAEPGKLNSGTLIDLDRFALQIWKDNEGRLEFGVFDSERDALKAYKGLFYYDPDANYRFEAEFERFDEVKKVMVLTAGSGERPFLRYATIRFTKDGEPVQLTAYKGSAESKVLFIPFRDTTSGKATYGAGRLMNAPEPDGDTIVLDLNTSINFPCAYAPAFHCPIPPRENWLTMAVEAGELDYPLPN